MLPAMLVDARAITLTIVLCAGAASAYAAGVKVEINGLPDEQRDAVRATLKLDSYDKRDITAAQLRSAYRDADEQIRVALEPFGYYDPKVTKQLSGDATSGWTARFDVTHG